MKFLLLLSLVGFCWAQYDPHTQYGRTSIVHLFEWRWVDIAKECERYLGPKGFGGVQVSPPNENAVINNPSRPWWERYQPISYKICTRSGNENEFRDMVTRCNNVGVRIYVDAVINHMCGSGNPAGTSSTCGSYYNPNNRDFPAVPYSGWDFNDGKCNGEINNYNDANQVRNCRLSGLLDLALDKDYVRTTIANYMNNLIDIGVAGFRLDAAKHMWPGDIKAVLDKLHNLNTKWFSQGSRPFIFQEVIDLGGEAIKSSEYFGNGRVTEFKFGAKLGTVIRKWNGEKMHNSLGLKWWKMNRDVNDWIGPPNNNGAIKEVTINADTTCGNGWVCEHRWRQIRNMVAFRNVVNGQPFSNWWDNGSNQVAFGRGNKGFIVFNNDDWSLSAKLQTGLPAGTYCDVISGDKSNGSCTGIKVQVSGDGTAQFSISNSAEDPFIAIHAESKL
uniref:Alpha-amylase n=1 Tax=Nannospalax galili TaxID=1026970 RepID=A0A8C6QDW0_NANGA